ncbi:putative cellulase [Helianthus annuus]|nr:putative cellulase [Helianthus annuus]KAJ0736604.1 putative cellulase [Helianthus annuus]KAJ0739549.1 putative cellulase [Helianthus annuus]
MSTNWIMKTPYTRLVIIPLFDELLWAAAWLYKATGESRYLKYAISHGGWNQAATEFSWDNKFVGAQILLAKEYFAGKHELETFKRGADSFVCAIMPNSSVVQIRTTPGEPSKSFYFLPG